MTDLREAAQMALDCIVSNQIPAAAEVKEALRAALAQPEPACSQTKKEKNT